MTVGGYIEPQLIRQEHHSCLQVLGAKAMTNHVVHFLDRGWAVEVLVLAVEIACSNISLEGEQQVTRFCTASKYSGTQANEPCG